MSKMQSSSLGGMSAVTSHPSELTHHWLSNLFNPSIPCPGIPDGNMQPYVRKRVALTNNLTGLTDYVLVWHPYSQKRVKVYVGQRVTDPLFPTKSMIGWDPSRSMVLDEDLSQSFLKSRLVSGSLELAVSTIPSGAFALNGRMTSTVFLAPFDPVALDPNSLTSYNTEFAKQNISAQEGLVCLALPAGKSIEFSPNQAAAGSPGSYLAGGYNYVGADASSVRWTNSDNPSKWAPILAVAQNTGFLVFDSAGIAGGDQDRGLNGQYFNGVCRLSGELMFAADYTSGTARAGTISSQVRIFYIDHTGVETVQYSTTINTSTPLDPTGRIYSSQTINEVVNLPFPVSRINVGCSLTVPGGNVDDIVPVIPSSLVLEGVESNKSNSFWPATMVSVSTMDAAATLSVTGIENHECLPNFSLSKELLAGFHTVGHLHDYELAMSYIRSGPLAQRIWTRSQYAKALELSEHEFRQDHLIKGYAFSFGDVLKGFKQGWRYVEPILKGASTIAGAFNPSFGTSIMGALGNARSIISPLIGMSADTPLQRGRKKGYCMQAFMVEKKAAAQYLGETQRTEYGGYVPLTESELEAAGISKKNLKQVWLNGKQQFTPKTKKGDMKDEKVKGLSATIINKKKIIGYCMDTKDEKFAGNGEEENGGDENEEPAAEENDEPEIVIGGPAKPKVGVNDPKKGYMPIAHAAKVHNDMHDKANRAYFSEGLTGRTIRLVNFPFLKEIEGGDAKDPKGYTAHTAMVIASDQKMMDDRGKPFTYREFRWKHADGKTDIAGFLVSDNVDESWEQSLYPFHDFPVAQFPFKYITVTATRAAENPDEFSGHSAGAALAVLFMDIPFYGAISGTYGMELDEKVHGKLPQWAKNAIPFGPIPPDAAKLKATAYEASDTFLICTSAAMGNNLLNAIMNDGQTRINILTIGDVIQSTFYDWMRQRSVKVTDTVFKNAMNKLSKEAQSNITDMYKSHPEQAKLRALREALNVKKQEGAKAKTDSSDPQRGKYEGGDVPYKQVKQLYDEMVSDDNKDDDGNLYVSYPYLEDGKKGEKYLKFVDEWNSIKRYFTSPELAAQKKHFKDKWEDKARAPLKLFTKLETWQQRLQQYKLGISKSKKKNKSKKVPVTTFRRKEIDINL